MRFGLDSLLTEVPAAQIDESRTFYSSRPAGRGPGTLGQLHDVRARRAAPAPVDPPAVAEIVEAEGARVAVRIFSPTAAQSRGVYLDIPGGGFYLDSAARSDARNRELADALELAVVSVDYRLAPEHPWPAAPDDCATAALWLLEEAVSSVPSSGISVAFLRSCSPSAAPTSCWRTTSHWLLGFPRLAMRSTSASTQSHPTASRGTPRQWPGRRSTASTPG